jgi:type VI secretion system protein ImpK
MSDDPFAEPTDNEATMIRPRPGGRVHAGGAAPAPSRQAPAAPVPTVGANPLIAAAAPLLAAAVRIGGERDRSPDVDRLKRGMIEAVRDFEQRAVATGLDTRSLRAARYALCATIDDLVLSTPWGLHSSWSGQTLTSIFHNEVIGGDRFFEILEEMEHDLGRHAEVVELMYLCASLGFEGRYRLSPRGTAGLTELRDAVYRTISQRRGGFERELSPHWRGLQTGYTPLLQRVPLWAVGLAALVITALVYLAFNLSLVGASGRAFEALADVPPILPVQVPRADMPKPPKPVVAAAIQPPKPVPPPCAEGSALSTALAQDIKDGNVKFCDGPQSVRLELANHNMFGAGSATLSKASAQLVERIGKALQLENGRIEVAGYTDDQPIHNLRFPSNQELSQARAGAVADIIGRQLTDPARLKAVGKGPLDPLVPNTSEENRAQNRRTEITLVRSAAAQ